MKKVFLSIVGFSMLCRLSAYSQVKHDSTIKKPNFSLYTPVGYDTSDYRPRRLRVDEIDLFSSYYNQDGDHSAVTGGIGTEKVTDISTGVNLNLVWFDQALRKNTLALGLGIDHHTSASSSYVAYQGGASEGGSRVYPSLEWSVENTKKGSTFGLGSYFSHEYNYQSIGFDVNWAQKTADKNGELGIKVQGYFDQVTQILPSEFVPPPTYVPPGSTTYTTPSGRTVITSTNGQTISSPLTYKPRTTLTAALSYSQVINARLQVMFLGDLVYQEGDLGLPFHRVYGPSFTNIATINGVSTNTHDAIEKLPSTRIKIPIGVRANYFLGDNIILRSYYRYFVDDWGIKAHTINLEAVYKISPFFSISPFYRFYTQTAAKYFAGYNEHSVTEQYYTSNYEYSNFNSQFVGAGLRLAPPKGVFGIQNLHELELRYGHYLTTEQLTSNVISLSLGFK
jgi:hypothetical protein